MIVKEYLMKVTGEKLLPGSWVGAGVGRGGGRWPGGWGQKSLG